jgi:pimeloyl-ACP methyl ester carboxylesterase
VKRQGVNVSDRSLVGTLRSLPAYPIESLGELLELMEETRALLGRLTQPVLLVHGDLDATVAREHIDALSASLARQVALRFETMPRSAHLLAIDHDRDRLAELAVSFARQQSASS